MTLTTRVGIEVCICTNADHPKHFHPQTSRCIKPSQCPLTEDEIERCRSEILGRYFNAQSVRVRGESLNRQSFRKNKQAQESTFLRLVREE